MKKEPLILLFKTGNHSPILYENYDTLAVIDLEDLVSVPIEVHAVCDLLDICIVGLASNYSYNEYDTI